MKQISKILYKFPKLIVLSVKSIDLINMYLLSATYCYFNLLLIIRRIIFL